MLTPDQIDELEKVIGQLKSLHSELTSLAKKSPSDLLNDFKLKMVVRVLDRCSRMLGKKYSPFDEFEPLSAEDPPSTSDATMLVSQFSEAVEKFRCDNIKRSFSGRWVYVLPGDKDGPDAAPPHKLKK